MKEYSIVVACGPCVGFKYGCHEDQDISCILASRSSIRREESHMIKILSVGFEEKNSRYGYKSAS